jgi:hypothetical protein
MPEGDLVTLARYNSIKSCETSSKNTLMLTLVHSTICGSNQDYNAMYRGHIHRVFYATLDGEVDKIEKSYRGWRPGVRQAFAALKRKPQPHLKTIQIGAETSVQLPIPDLWNRFVYFNGCTNAVHYWQMNGKGVRHDSTPVLPLKVLNQAGLLELFEQRGQLLPVGGESSGMLQKPSGVDVVIDINKVLGGSSPSLGGTEGSASNSSQAFGISFNGAGNDFETSHHCCSPP